MREVQPWSVVGGDVPPVPICVSDVCTIRPIQGICLELDQEFLYLLRHITRVGACGGSVDAAEVALAFVMLVPLVRLCVELFDSVCSCVLVEALLLAFFLVMMRWQCQVCLALAYEIYCT